MKVLITGSQGLIGYALSQKLRELGFEVKGMDVAVEPHHSEFGNILDDASVTEGVKDVDGIVHLAAVSRVIFGETHPKLCWKTNVDGTEKLIEAAKNSSKRPWLIYASSREVYGQQKNLPVSESAPLSPVNIYGESKVAAEQAITRWQKQGGRGSIVRLSNVYGSIHDHSDRVIPAFCHAAATGNPIRVDGSDNLFDFTYIDDVIQGLLAHLSLLSSIHEPLPPIHFVSGETTSLGEAARIARDASTFPLEIREAPSRDFDVATFAGDPSRALDLLGWKACVDVKQGMSRLINQYRLNSRLNQLVHDTV